MNWFTSLSLKTKLLLLFVGLVISFSLIPSEEPGPAPKTGSDKIAEVTGESEEPNTTLGEDESGSEEAEEESAPKEQTEVNQPSVKSETSSPPPAPKPAPAPQPKPAPKPEPKPQPTPEPAPQPEPEPIPNCEPSYPDVCIPVGSADYDCAGGSGDGPNYIQGPVRVLWNVLYPDPHRLDRDKDGWGCES